MIMCIRGLLEIIHMDRRNNKEIFNALNESKVASGKLNYKIGVDPAYKNCIDVYALNAEGKHDPSDCVMIVSLPTSKNKIEHLLTVTGRTFTTFVTLEHGKPLPKKYKY